MSYRELRNFVEMMKALGYQRLISVENFRRPNFELVADVLFWLTHRYDPNSELSDDISDEDKRVDFLKTVAQIMATKARIKLNIKQLYKADGYAVKELLKICSLLYDAINAQTGSDAKVPTDVQLGTKLNELRNARNLATEIVDSGAKLYTLLGKEEELKKSRDRALAFLDSIALNLESNGPHEQIEKNIREQVQIIADNVADLEKMCADLEKDHKSLKDKITRKEAELERIEKRYKGLKKVKVPFMEEYEALEKELKGVYDVYLERFRNLNYLESELHKYHLAERAKKAESDKALARMQKRLREEEWKILRGEQSVDENMIDASFGDSGKDEFSDNEENKKKKSGGGGGGGIKNPNKVFGAMDADDSDESDSDSDASLGVGGGGMSSGSSSGSASESEEGGKFGGGSGDGAENSDEEDEDDDDEYF